MLDVSLCDLLGGLDAPAGEDLIGIVAIVMMVVMMTAAAVTMLMTFRWAVTTYVSVTVLNLFFSCFTNIFNYD